MRIPFACVIVVGWLGLQGGMARAATPATCSMDWGTLTLTVAVNGVPATLSSDAIDGVNLNGTFCVDPDAVDTIDVVGGPLDDKVTLAGRFTPGFSYEPDFDEIEIDLDLGAGVDTAIVKLTATPDDVSLSTEGLAINTDADVDVAMTGIEIVKIFGLAGNDHITAAPYFGPAAVYLYGGPGDDTLQGGFGAGSGSYLSGDAGNDWIEGSGGDDVIVGGSGHDQARGFAGNDRFEEGAVLDPFDILLGGSGVDTVDYGERTSGVTVSLGDMGLFDDGEVGELDDIGRDVESATGGSGDDVLRSESGVAHTLIGGAGDDYLEAGGGGGTLTGGPGSDTLHGSFGPDLLNGNGGDDDIWPWNGDTVYAGAGNDVIYNLNAFADIIRCGAGTDDAEVDPLDTLTACEL